MFSILRSKKLNLKYGTASLLEVESGSNDPVAYLMTTILLAMMTSEITPGKMLYMIFAQIVYGVGIGAVLAVCTVFFLRRFRFEVSGFDTVFMAAVAILSYVLPVLVGVLFTLLHALIQAYVLTMLTALFYGEVSEHPEPASGRA